MATFHIHQDSEKENPNNVHQDKVKNAHNGKDKRSTFAVLGNLANNGRGPAAGKTAFREVKINNAQTENDENVGAIRPQQKKVIASSTTVPVEQFKTFSVYEDNSSTAVPRKEMKKCDENLNSSHGAIAIRDHLKDLPHYDGTPMSVSDVLSPMSVDKSSLHVEDDSKKPLSTTGLFGATSPVPRNDRQRFFEVVEYQHNILEYFKENEKKHRPKPTYMKRQPDINYSMRTILIDWLVEVGEEYRLETETLYLAVSYIDRFLSHMSVVRAKLQLVGTAAMYIAAKYEEIYPPDVGEFVFITDDTYTKAQVLRMEQIILKILSFDLCVPTNYVFINTYAVLCDMPDQVKFLAHYISELSLLEGDPYLQYLPSQISSAAVALARYILEFPIWSSELEELTNYTLENLSEIILHLCRTHNLSIDLAQQAIQEKYKDRRYLEVSIIKPVQITSEKFEEILNEYKKIELEQTVRSEQATTNNESVRKMISSLMFV